MEILSLGIGIRDLNNLTVECGTSVLRTVYGLA